jgi:hypothetical protein
MLHSAGPKLKCTQHLNCYLLLFAENRADILKERYRLLDSLSFFPIDATERKYSWHLPSAQVFN